MYPFKTTSLHHLHVNTPISGVVGGSGVQNLNIPPPISSSSVAAAAASNNLMLQNQPPPPPIQQWPLNQADYQNVANDQVDWAALAQQWIFMKETSTTDDLLAAPPPPIISKREFAEEQGEAPMEVEKDDEDLMSTMNLDAPPAPSLDALSKHWAALAAGGVNIGGINELATNSSGPWQSAAVAAAVQQSQWRKKPGWNTWTNPNMPPGMQLQQQQQPQQQQSPSTNILNRPPPFLSTDTLNPPLQSSFSNSDPVTQLDVNSDSYWQRVSAIPALMDSQINEPRIKPLMSTEQQYPSPLDAAKRKTLPTWIRQGLEKMEREKQKLAEKEKERQEHAALVEQRKLAAAAEVECSLAAGELPFIVKSKFDSDSDSDDDVGKNVPSSKRTKEKSKSPLKIERTHKSKQEQLQELMLLVRGSLTEILLEVTNEEIRNIATKTLSKSRLKARTAQTVKKSALTSLTGGLGLGIYADSDNSGESSDYDDNDDDGEDNNKKDNDSKNNKKESDNESDGNDSYYELQESIKRRKTAFESKSRDIEKCLALEAEKERHWLGEDEDDSNEINDEEESNIKQRHKNGNNSLKKPLSYERNDYKNNYYQRNISAEHLSGGGSGFKETGEIQHEKNYVNYHGRMSERKTTRFSDPKDTVKTLHLTHGSIIFENSIVPSQHTMPTSMSSAIAIATTSIPMQIPSITQHNISATTNSLLTAGGGGGPSSHQSHHHQHHKRNNDSSENSNSPTTKSSKSSRKHSKSKKRRQNSTEDDDDGDDDDNVDHHHNDRDVENDRYRHRSKREKSRDRQHRHHRNRRSRSSSSEYDRYRSSSHHNRHHHKSSHSNSRNPSSKSSSRYDRHSSHYDDDHSDSYRRSHSRERSSSTKNGGGGGNGSRRRSRSRSKSKDSKYSSHSRNADNNLPLFVSKQIFSN